MTNFHISIPGYVKIVSKTCSHFPNFIYISATFYAFVHYFFRISALNIRKEVPDISYKMCIKCSSASTSINLAASESLLCSYICSLLSLF